MAISNIGSQYSSIYNAAPTKSESTSETPKTAADELAYLSKKYEGYSFIGANYSQGMRYGSKDTVNVAISPAFLNKMANDPELAEKYEKEIANMKVCDEQKMRNLEGRGDKILAKGWAIDENGGISSWTVGIPGGNIRVKSPTEYANELYEKKKAAQKNDTSTYLKSLQDRSRSLELSVGSEINMSKDKKIGAVTINQSILDKAANDPATAKNISELVAGIEKAEKAAAGYYNSIGGVTERTSHWYIDENGNCQHFAYVRRDDDLNKKLRQDAEKATNDLIERSREKAREQRNAEREEMRTEIKKSTAGTPKTAADELAYLQKNYNGISFVAADFRPGMRYGSNTTTNIAISPKFLQKMADDPELAKQYEEQFEGMKRFDEANVRSHEAAGRRIVAQGWAIDENGGMSKWSISEGTDKRHHAQEMTDYFNDLREEKAEQKKKQEKLDKKREAAKEAKEAQQSRIEELRIEKTNSVEELLDKFRNDNGIFNARA